MQRRLYAIHGTGPGTCGAACTPGIERFIWDGDQILAEIRAPVESEYDTSTGDHYGRVLYTHGGQIDQPLSLVRVDGPDTLSIIPHANWRGMFQTANFSDGSLSKNGFHVAELPLPEARMDRFLGEIVPDQQEHWFGSLLSGMADASGQMYRRNRYYDPQTGRFTQEDPIGLAGGLNLYGFGGGDPVNYRFAL